MGKVHLAKGVDINPAWTNAIAVSRNGVDWAIIKSNQITRIGQAFTENAQFTTFPTKTTIVIVMVNEQQSRYEAQEVVNQPTWNAGTQAALNLAVSDITEWLS